VTVASRAKSSIPMGFPSSVARSELVQDLGFDLTDRPLDGESYRDRHIGRVCPHYREWLVRSILST
jgi:hypothetical protein